MQKETTPEFDGDDYVSSRDKPRLTQQIHQVRMYMENNNWLSVKQISDDLNFPEPSVSAQIRNLRKEKFGNRIVERRYQGNGLYEFKLMPKDDDNEET